MACFTYHGYVGSVNYSQEDKVYFGRILNISDLVTYESETEEGLKQEFIKAVHEYAELKGCSYLDLDKKVK